MLKTSLLRSLIFFLAVAGAISCNRESTNTTQPVKLSQYWQIFSTDSVGSDGSLVSSNSFHMPLYYRAEMPSTVFNAMVKNRVYDSIYVGTNLKNIDTSPFKKPWWYRNLFNIDDTESSYELRFKGINYKANIWLNGQKVADTSDVNNAFKMYSFDVSRTIKRGGNILAVEVFPPKAGDFTIGFVDWNPSPPDNNMGIFRTVELNKIDKVQITEPYVESYFVDNDYSKAYENVSCVIKNYSDTNISGDIEISVNNNIIHKSVEIGANKTLKVLFLAKDYSGLIVTDPQLWWPYTLGEPVLHSVKFRFSANNIELAERELEYGIREIKDYYNEAGHRGFLINGKKISIRGAGWVDNIILDNTHDYDRAQLEYVKNMNLNTIRMEGFWGKDDFIYRTCDELGILIMVGWSCQWEWEDYLGKSCDEKYGGIISDGDINMMGQAWEDQVIWLRNHPAIFAWFGGSDCIATPKLENRYLETFNSYDSSRIFLPSAKEWESNDIKSGVKMRGPYAYEPPVYWYSDTLYGGAFGFNTETGPGAQVPPIESIKRMIPPKNLWPIDEVWEFHCGRNEFNSLDRYTKALYKRYGKANSAEEYATKAQLLNYELMRPMFESFSANRYRATGVIQWMLNSAWPEMYWQLFDSYLMPNGSFYATKKAGEPIHALYNYNNRGIYLVNDRLERADSISVKIRVYDIESNLIYSKEIIQNIAANTSINIFQIPKLKNLSDTYFIDLRVIKTAKEIANNFYWLSTKDDILDYDFKFDSWYFHTPSKQYADYSMLNSMKKVVVDSKLIPIQPDGSKKSDYSFYNVELKNTSSTIAFFIELQLVDEESGDVILPVIWGDNYVSLLPNENRSISVKVNKRYISNSVKLRVKGYNFKILNNL